MAKIGEQEKLKSQTALIRCAKAALLLSSLKNATINTTTHGYVPQLQDEEKVEKLKSELVKEKLKLKVLRLWLGVGMLFCWLCILLFLLFLVVNYL